MGGSSGGYISSADMEKLAAAAKQRISDAFAQTRRIAFVCGADDAAYFAALIANTPIVAALDTQLITDHNDASAANLANFSLVVACVNVSNDHAAINAAIQAATGIRKTVLFVRTNEASPIPQYVLQYRIRTMYWQDLVDILGA